MKIKVLEHTGSFVPGFADVSEEVAARLFKAGHAEPVTEGAKEEKAHENPVLSPENTGSGSPSVNEETNTEGAKTAEGATEIKENV